MSKSQASRNTLSMGIHDSQIVLRLRLAQFSELFEFLDCCLEILFFVGSVRCVQISPRRNRGKAHRNSEGSGRTGFEPGTAHSNFSSEFLWIAEIFSGSWHLSPQTAQKPCYHV